MSTLRYFLTTAITLLASQLLASQPNVLLVITDDQGYGDIGYHGNREIRTPTLDALARSSLRLTNFHVEPTCAETRAALMTGQYPLRGAVWHTVMGRSILRRSSTTMAQLFKQAGYRTGMFGKWHLGDNYPYRPQDRGFDVTLHHGGGGVGQVPDVWGNDYFDDVYWSGDKLVPKRGYCTDVFFDAAKKFIQSSDGRQPFFCYLATNAPHSPYNVASQYKQPYLDQGIEEPRASFYGMISNIDDNVSQLLDQLDRQHIAEDTVVIFMTDNGTAAGYVQRPANEGGARGFNAGMRANKGSQYDGGHRTPCFIRYAQGLPTDQDFSHLCAHIDLVPTLARLCNLKVDPQKLDGRDLVDYVRAQKPWENRTHFVQSHRVEEPAQYRKSAILTDKWRLIDGQDLFEVEQDPGQTKPLPAGEYSETIKTLRASYDAWWETMQVDPSQYSNIPLGDPAAPRVRLTAHDWHGPQPLAYQEQVLKDPITNGFWAVDVVQPGVYQFLLSRRPLDEPAPIQAVRAKVELAGKVAETEVNPSAVMAPLTLRLDAGLTHLTTELVGADGSSRGAYFVNIHFLGDLSDEEIEAGKRLPVWLNLGDRVAWLGGTLVERAADSGAIEAELLLRSPLAGLTFVNLGWSGDDFTGRARAVFGTTTDGRARRLADIQKSGASVVVITYGMSELLAVDVSNERIAGYKSDLNELLSSLKSQGQRSVICLPPELADDIEGTAATPLYRTMVHRYQTFRPVMLAMLESLAQERGLPVIQLPTVSTSQFESGTYLSRQGYERLASDLGQSVYETVLGSRLRSAASQAELAKRARESNRLFFDMVRPQNETYLLLFRKHEQGNNAVELGQHRALLAERQLELLFAASRD